MPPIVTRLLTGAMLVGVLVACPSPSTGSVITVTINEGDQSIAVGGTLTLSATVERSGDVSDTVMWSSSNETVATIDAEGHVTGHTAGTTTITATSTTDLTKSDRITLTVTEGGSVESVTIEGGDQTIATGGTVTLTATVETIGDASDMVTWSSSNEDVATIDGEGHVSGHTAGSTIITAASIADTSKNDSIILAVNPPGSLAWTRQFGTVSDDYARGITSDAIGNVYATGYTYGVLGDTHSGSSDTFIHSYDKDGTLRWTRQFGTRSADSGDSITTDADGNVYASGFTRGRLGDANAANTDAFIRSYDSDGNLRWYRAFGTTDTDDAAPGLTTDAHGNVYATGHTRGALEGVSAGAYDAFIQSRDSDGALRWTRQFGTSTTDLAFAIAADANGNVYAFGETYGALGGPNAGNSDAFIRSYDSNGTLRWARQFGTSDQDTARGIAIDANGNVYATGYTIGALEGTNTGGTDVFIRSFDSDGTHRWTRQFGTSTTDFAIAIAADANGNVYATGSTAGSLDGPNAGSNDAFIRSYDSNGTLRWTRQFGTSSSDIGRGVATDATSVYIAGETLGALEGVTAGSHDAFIRKYGH